MDVFGPNTPSHSTDRGGVPDALLDGGETTPSGVSLEDLLHGVRTDGPPPLGVITSILYELCSALAFAHERGSVHGDLRPRLLLLGTTGHLHVLGLSNERPAGAHHSYAPPESIAGAAPTTRSDVYSVGVIAYELITGRPLFGDHMDLELRTCVGSHIAAPSDHNPDCSPALDAFVLRAVKLAPQERWHSAPQMRDALGEIGGAAPMLVRRWLTGTAEPVDAVPSLALAAPPEELPKPPKRAARGSVRLPRNDEAFSQRPPSPVSSIHRAATQIRTPTGARPIRLPIEPAQDLDELLEELELVPLHTPQEMPVVVANEPTHQVQPVPDLRRRSPIVSFTFAFLAGAGTLYALMQLLG